MITSCIKFASNLKTYRFRQSAYSCYGSLTKKETNSLRGCILQKNPTALIYEVLKISKETYRRYPNDPVEKDNLNELIAQVCVCAENVEFDLAFEILEYLDSLQLGSMVLGTLELVDKCIEFGHLTEAMKAYMRLHNAAIRLDLSRKELMISVLATDCRIADLIVILKSHSITDTDLTLAAEPLIISGNVLIYSDFISQYLDQKRLFIDPIQDPEEVSRIIRSIMSARLRRFFPDSSESSELENEGMMKILKSFQSYYLRASYSTLPKYSDVLTSQSYFQYRQLCEMERERGLTLIDDSVLPNYGANISDHLPEFETTDFPYVSEGNGQIHIEPIHRVRIRDLTAELKRKYPTHSILFNKNLFPDAYEMVNVYLQQRTLIQTLKNEMKKRGILLDIVFRNNLEDGNESDDDDNDVDDEDDEIYPYMNPSGHSGLSPPYSLFDISHFMELSKPPLHLLFDNEIFDHPHDVEVDDERFFNARQRNHNNDTNINDDNYKSNDLIFLRVTLPEDEEPDSK